MDLLVISLHDSGGHVLMPDETIVTRSGLRADDLIRQLIGRLRQGFCLQAHINRANSEVGLLKCYGLILERSRRMRRGGDAPALTC